MKNVLTVLFRRIGWAFAGFTAALSVCLLISCSREDDQGRPKSVKDIGTKERQKSYQPFTVKIIDVGPVGKSPGIFADLPEMFGVVVMLKSQSTTNLHVSITDPLACCVRSDGRAYATIFFQQISLTNACVSIKAADRILVTNITPYRFMAGSLAICDPLHDGVLEHRIPEYHGLVRTIGAFTQANGFDYPAWNLFGRLSVEYDFFSTAGSSQADCGTVIFGLLFHAVATNPPVELHLLGESYPLEGSSLKHL